MQIEEEIAAKNSNNDACSESQRDQPSDGHNDEQTVSASE